MKPNLKIQPNTVEEAKSYEYRKSNFSVLSFILALKLGSRHLIEHLLYSIPKILFPTAGDLLIDSFTKSLKDLYSFWFYLLFMFRGDMDYHSVLTSFLIFLIRIITTCSPIEGAYVHLSSKLIIVFAIVALNVHKFDGDTFQGLIGIVIVELFNHPILCIPIQSLAYIKAFSTYSHLGQFLSLGLFAIALLKEPYLFTLGGFILCLVLKIPLINWGAYSPIVDLIIQSYTICVFLYAIHFGSSKLKTTNHKWLKTSVPGSIISILTILAMGFSGLSYAQDPGHISILPFAAELYGLAKLNETRVLSVYFLIYVTAALAGVVNNYLDRKIPDLVFKTVNKKTPTSVSMSLALIGPDSFVLPLSFLKILKVNSLVYAVSELGLLALNGLFLESLSIFIIKNREKR